MRVKDFLNILGICNAKRISIIADKIYTIKPNERNVNNNIENLIISTIDITGNEVRIFTVAKENIRETFKYN